MILPRLIVLAPCGLTAAISTQAIVILINQPRQKIVYGKPNLSA